MASIAITLANGLLSGIAGKVGALIFDKVFPPGVPSYFSQVYDEIRKIVRQEITQNSIDEVDGEINGLKNWVENTYTPRRESQPGIPKRDLFDLLSPKEGDLTISAIGVLQQQRFAEPGLGVFMIAAGMHLAILQELAYVDPTTDDPQKSSYVESIKLYAQHYADYAIKTYNSVEKKRVAYVDETGQDVRVVPIIPDAKPFPFYPGTQTFITYSWEDDYTKEKYSYTTSVVNVPFSGLKWTPVSQEEAKKTAEENMQKHIANVKSKLTSDLHDPKGTAAIWRKLIEQPLVKP